jgi:hypothetical protein
MGSFIEAPSRAMTQVGQHAIHEQSPRKHQ